MPALRIKAKSAGLQNLRCLSNLRPALGNQRSKINALQNHMGLAAMPHGDPWDKGKALPSLLAALHAGLSPPGPTQGSSSRNVRSAKRLLASTLP